MLPHSFTWIFALACIQALIDAASIGANDVANSFATAVGSRSLTLRQACVISLFSEFLGAFLLGAGTAETIKGKIIDPSKFQQRPDLLMLAMYVALLSSSTWVWIATLLGMPVSTTHSLVGSIVGVGLAVDSSVVKWGWDGGGVSFIIAGWVLSPLFALVVGFILYSAVKWIILHNDEKSYSRAKWIIPIEAFIVLTVIAFFIIYKGAPGMTWKKMPVGQIVGIAIGLGAGGSAFLSFFVVPWVMLAVEYGMPLPWWKVPIAPFLLFQALCSGQAKVEPAVDDTTETRTMQVQVEGSERNSTSPEAITASGESAEGKEKPNSTPNSTLVEVPLAAKKLESEYDEDDETCLESIQSFPGKVKADVIRFAKKAWDAATYGWNYQIKTGDHGQAGFKHHEGVRRFDKNAEQLFIYVQVITSIFASFAHGSNDVANAVGPYSVVLFIWEHGVVDLKKVPVDPWVLAIGGLMISVGFFFHGYHILDSLGNRLTYHSPSRGVIMELSAIIVVLSASKLGLPVSTTHCISGATVGVGLVSGIGAVKWSLFGKIILSWAFTLPFAGGLSFIIYSLLTQSPSQTVEYTSYNIPLSPLPKLAGSWPLRQGAPMCELTDTGAVVSGDAVVNCLVNGTEVVARAFLNVVFGPDGLVTNVTTMKVY